MKKLSFSVIVAATFCTTMVGEINAEQPKAVPIMLLPDSDHGTCSIGLQVNAGGAVMRSGPSWAYPVVARLQAGHVVSGCAEHQGWDGVIDGTDEDCEVGISVTRKRPYKGACASGWIDQRSLTSIYG